MKKILPFLLIAGTFLSSCDKDEPLDDGGSGNPPPVITPNGCVIQSVLAENTNPLYTYEYVPGYPSVLNSYKEYDANSGDVTHTYVMHYEEFSGTFQLDSMFHYYGDVVGADGYADVTVYSYSYLDGGWVRMDSTEILLRHWMTGELIPKGKEYYDYDESDMMTNYSYLDNPYTDVGTNIDTYYVDYTYDENDQMTEMHTFNYQDVEVYYEIHQLSDYIQPNYRFIANRTLAQANLYAPLQTTAWSTWTSTYTYDYIYQVNDDDYIVEQDLVESDGDIVFLKLFNYECY